MSSSSAPAVPTRIGAFKAWLSVWIVMAMVAGLAFGLAAPQAFEALGSYAIAQVNPVTATLVWLMILPTMVQIDYSKLPAIWASRHGRPIEEHYCRKWDAERAANVRGRIEEGIKKVPFTDVARSLLGETPPIPRASKHSGVDQGPEL